MFQYTMIAFEVCFIIRGGMSSSTLKHFLDQLSSLNLLERKGIQEFGLFSWFGDSYSSDKTKKKFKVGNKILRYLFLAGDLALMLLLF